MQRADAAPVSPAKASAPPLTPPPGGRRRCRPEKERKMRKPPIFGAPNLLAATPALFASTPPRPQAVTATAPAVASADVAEDNLVGEAGDDGKSDVPDAHESGGDNIHEIDGTEHKRAVD